MINIIIYVAQKVFTAYWSTILFNYSIMVLAITLLSGITFKLYIFTCIAKIFMYYIIMSYLLLPFVLCCEELLHITVAKGKGLRSTVKAISIKYLKAGNKVIMPLAIGVKFRNIPQLVDSIHIIGGPLFITTLCMIIIIFIYFTLRDVSVLLRAAFPFILFLLGYWFFSIFPVSLFGKNDSTIVLEIARRLNLPLLKLLCEITAGALFYLKGLFCKYNLRW